MTKPCTKTEIDFYQAANAEYPALAYFMPRFIGTLQLNKQVSTVASTGPSTTTSVANLPNANGGARLPARLPPPLNLKASNATPSIPEHSVPFPHPVSPSQVSLPVPRSPLGHRRTPSPTIDPLYRMKGKPLSTDTCIVLSAATAGFSRPNILDLKLGSRLWADDAPPAKRQRLDRVSKTSTSSSLGFRIAGMRLWQGDGYWPEMLSTTNGTPFVMVEAANRNGTATIKVTDGATGKEHEDRSFEPETGYMFYNKLYGRNRTLNDIKDAFLEYFIVESSGVDKHQALEVIRRCREDVEEMQLVLEDMETRMYSSSILIVYEGDPEAWREAKEVRSLLREREEREALNGADEEVEVEDEEEDEDEPNTHAVKLIDFAHAEFTPGAGADENVLHGVRSTVRVLQELEDDLIEELNEAKDT